MIKKSLKMMINLENNSSHKAIIMLEKWREEEISKMNE
jgi:hypothetical protein